MSEKVTKVVLADEDEASVMYLSILLNRLGVDRTVPAESGQEALKILKLIKEKTETLYLHPNRGRIVPELQEHGILQYREILVKRWRIIYRVDDTEKKVIVFDIRPRGDAYKH